MHKYFLFLLPTVAIAANLPFQQISISNEYLVMSIGIGSPAQNFDLMLDLDENKAIVLDKKTQNDKLDFKYDYIKSLYDPIESNTANLTEFNCRQQFIDSNGDLQNTYGIYADDSINLANVAHQNANFRFCNLNMERNTTKVSEDPLQWLMKLPIDGILGLQQQNNINLFQSLGYKQITMFLDKNATEEVDNIGQLTLGEDSLNCGKFQKFPTFDSKTWRILAQNLTYDGQNLVGPLSIKLNLHSDQLIVPQKIYNSILKSFGGQFYGPCNKYRNQPNLEFTVYNTFYSIPINDYFRPSLNDQNTCYLNVDQSKLNVEDQVQLDRSFLKKYCLVLDYENTLMGLAQTISSSPKK